MKKSIAWAMCLLLCLALAGCSKEDSSTLESEVSSSISSSEESSSVASDSLPNTSIAPPSSPETPAPGGELSSSLADFQIQLGGDVFSVPCTFQDFFDKGWEADKDVATWELEDRQTSTTRLLKGDSYFSVSFANTSGGTQMAVDSTIYTISVGATVSGGPKVDMMMPGGITYGATVDDLKAAYGEPDTESERDDLVSLTYLKLGGYQGIRFTVYHEGGLMQLQLDRLEVK